MKRNYHDELGCVFGVVRTVSVLGAWAVKRQKSESTSKSTSDGLDCHELS